MLEIGDAKSPIAIPVFFFLLGRRKAKTRQGDGFLRNQVVGVDGITTRSGTAEELARPAIVYRLTSGEGNYPKVPFATTVSTCALLVVPKQIGGPCAPKWCRSNIGARRCAESTAENSGIIDPGRKPHGPAVYRCFIITKGCRPSFGDRNQLA